MYADLCPDPLTRTGLWVYLTSPTFGVLFWALSGCKHVLYCIYLYILLYTSIYIYIHVLYCIYLYIYFYIHLYTSPKHVLYCIYLYILLYIGVSMSYIVYICIYLYIHLYTCPILYISLFILLYTSIYMY